MAAIFQAKEFASTYAKLLLQPSFTVWNRLEALPFSDDLARSLGAEVRDPLWMLARQWQAGEFRGEDAGTPLIARLAFTETQLAAFKPGDAAAASPINAAAPLEAAVEAEPIGDNLLLALRIGRLWLAGLTRQPGLAATHGWFVQRFAVPAPAAALPVNLAEAREAANPRRRPWQDLAARRGLVDGLALIAWLRKPAAERPPGLGAAADSALKAFGDQFLAAHEAQFISPSSESAYQRGRFEYRFEVATGAEDGGERLTADQYDGKRLDWAAFERVPPAAAPAPASEVVRFLPQGVSFPGSPANRWWEFEDRRVDLTGVMGGPTDLAKMLMVEFGLVYGNDWFVVPLKAPLGSLLRVQGVVVTDDFGDETFVPADDQLVAGSGAQASTLFTLTGQDGSLPTESVLFVPPAAPARMRGDPLDRVHLLRDEMANLAWAVEQIVPDGCGGGMDAHAAAARTRNLLDPPEPTDPLGLGRNALNSPAAIRWRLQTQAPDNWIPFTPVHVEGSVRQIRFQQAAMPWNAAPNPEAKILPRGELLGRTAADLPFFLFEEEVPRAGALVERAFTRSRWIQGHTAVWIGREKRNGRGEGSSGLAFDGLVDPLG